jgi:hypothetical protein
MPPNHETIEPPGTVERLSRSMPSKIATNATVASGVPARQGIRASKVAD